MLSQWVLVMLCYDDPLVVNHVVFYVASGCESLTQYNTPWLWKN